MAENVIENIKKLNELLGESGLPAIKESVKKSGAEIRRIKAALEEKGKAFAAARIEKERAEAEKTEAEASEAAEPVAPEMPAEVKPAEEEKPAAPVQEVKAEAVREEPAAPEKPVEEVKPQVKETPAAPAQEEKKKPAMDTSSWLRKPDKTEEKRPVHRREVYTPAGQEARPPRKEYIADNQSRGQNRNGGQGRGPAQRPFVPKAAPMMPPPQAQKPAQKKKTGERSYEEKKTVNKRALIKNSVTVADFDENKSGYRKLRPAKKQKAASVSQAIKIEKAVITTELIPLKVLSEKIGISAIEITKKLFKEGIMKTINDAIDFDTAAYIAADLGIELELKLEKTAEDILSEGFTEDAENDEALVKRPPVVTVMGHVDHGKTSLLDRIRKTNVTAGEAGGITQHIGAYQVSVNGKPITFLDTPGHAAFTAMRARGAQATDIAILVVAADDGIMPQTIEAINHAKAANVPIIVAVNKIDKPEANIDRIKTQLTEQGLVPEEWGGDVMLCPVSAKSGEGIEGLLESVILLADLKDLKANPDRKAKGVVIEAKLDQSKGPVANVLIQNGTLKVGDPIIIGTVTGKIRAMLDDKGRRVSAAGPSVPVSIMGLDEVPSAGDIMYVVSQELTRKVAEERKNKAKDEQMTAQKVSLDDVFNRIAEGEMKTLNIIVKADVQGSVEAVKQSLVKLSNDEVKVNVIHAAAGAISETDIMLAESSDAIIIGFNVRPDSNAKNSAEKSGVDIKLYRVIYEAIEDVEKALKGMLAPRFNEIYMGKAEVRETFKITGVGMVAGCYVTEGKIVRNGKLRIYRDDVMICEGNVNQLKRFKDDVKEVQQGFECGISIEKFNDIKIGDFIESYIVEEVKA